MIVRLGSMGDVIHALHAVTALRQSAPHMTIGWLIERRWAELLCAPSTPACGPISAQRPLVDIIHTVDTFAWRHSLFSAKTWRAITKTRKDLRYANYEAVLDLQGAIRSALMSRWAGSHVIYGADEPREKPARIFYTRRIAAQGVHVIEHSFSLVKSCMPLSRTSAVALPHDPAAEEKIAAWLAERQITDFAVLNPGAGWGAKQWPSSRYAEVAKQLAREGIPSLINFGPAEESLAHSVEAESGGVARPIACSITELIALTRRARLFIGGDTGPMHLAAALQVPVVAIFGPTDPARNGPWGIQNIVLRSSASPTSYSHVKDADPGLLQIQAEQVVEAACQLLRSSHG